MKKILLATTAIILLCLVSIAVSIVSYSRESSDVKADAAIVLGAAVWDGKPSPVFEERIKHAVKIYQSGQVKKIIFTGGVGSGDDTSEAQVAKDYAISKGVASGDIWLEDKSKYTIENLKFTTAILTSNKFSAVLIVSDPLHMKRAMTMALDLGMQALPSPTETSRYQSFSSKSKLLLSEVFYFFGYKLFNLLP